MSTASTDPLIGRILDDRYVVRSRIARGGMATVYVATDKRLERRVAVKVMHDHLAEDNAFKRRFDQEARSAARLSHPNVVNVYDQGEDAELAYLVMEYLPGITLRDLLKSQGSLTADQTLEISEAVLSGLAAAHNEKIVHRDLKPENILLADDGRIKLSDFGLARAASANTTTGQALLGTIAYLSPELVTKGLADERSDIYAFGIVMYEMLTGVQPFVGEQPMQIAYQHANEDVPLPSAVTTTSTPELDRLVRWATQRDPAHRPTDAKMLLDELRHVRSGASINPSSAFTTVMPPLDFPTSTTTVIHPTPPVEPAPLAQVAPAPQPPSSIDSIRVTTARRRRQGALTLGIVLATALALGVTGWWFGAGPGSLIAIPNVVNKEVSTAQSELAALDLSVTTNKCPSLTVPVGSVTEMKPAAGTRVAHDSDVIICESTGPRLLPVPELVGLDKDAAITAITEAEFVFGSVTEEKFTPDSPRGTVLAAVDADGNTLGAQLNEQETINLVVSAGQIPAVAGLTLDRAAAALADAGLVYDPTQNIETYSSTVAQGIVIALTRVGDVVHTGDALGLEVSRGPELFEVPDVTGKSIKDAMSTIAAAGFKAETSVPELFWGVATVSETTPQAGDMVEKGTTITLTFAGS
ncbi:Stk1 family PASTA domain-containing Ser/Thr kinase [Klugiella xanthotipulae]|uniref:non-specific serine/threonine protein kinase n=1 Tax=Klugiella xanthotipulae TaxID=244735 RepID=A0A543HT03_9MICO|nr:Stk1 family PASTA domain-containing Ser/Thr kinase [Klugiella xanthotipulae]TQM61487.1 serine/threonine-protein kinase [Klugiella xanthotipulae]